MTPGGGSARTGPVVRSDRLDEDHLVRVWASSGAMHLTGSASGPPSAVPAGIVSPLHALAEALASATASLGRQVVVDPVALVTQRAAFTRFGRNGSTSAGGFARMVRAADGWVVLNLPRPCDVASLPALVNAQVDGADWHALERRVASMAVAEVVDRAVLLGLAAAAVGATPSNEAPWVLHGEAPAPRAHSAPVIVDLTSLWAGPLAGGLLAAAGCRVLKVESQARPDGARRGPGGFFDLLNGDKEHLSLALPEPRAVEQLRSLIARADLVLEASRPRVMSHWGISPEECVAAGKVWVSITGHGRHGRGRNRVAFGDDAAVSGGLVLRGEPPMFVGDAIADPIAGLAAATVAAQLLSDRRAALADVPLAGVAAWAAELAGGEIRRVAVRHGSGWAVELSDGPVTVRPPAVGSRLTATVGSARELAASWAL